MGIKIEDFLDDTLGEMTKDLEPCKHEKFMDALCFIIEHNTPYFRGEVPEPHTPEENYRAYMAHRANQEREVSNHK